MRVYLPYEGIDPRKASAKGVELWAPYPEHTALLVSNLGRVVHQEKEVVRVYQNSKTGYLHVILNRDVRPYVHQLVMRVFEPGPPGRIYRLNDDRTDNRLCNLTRDNPRSR